MQPRRRSRWQLATALAFLVPALLVALALTTAAASPTPSGASGASGASGPSGAGAVAGDPAAGQQVYNANCTACHGANLGGGIGKKLNPIEGGKKNLDPQYLIDTISNGVAGTQMAAWKGKLKDADIQNLAAFIIKSNQAGTGGNLTPAELARSNVFWVAVGIAAMCLLTYLLARYNMRWIDRRARARAAASRDH